MEVHASHTILPCLVTYLFWKLRSAFPFNRLIRSLWVDALSSGCIKNSIGRAYSSASVYLNVFTTAGFTLFKKPSFPAMHTRSGVFSKKVNISGSVFVKGILL